MARLNIMSKFGHAANKAEADFARETERAGKTWIYQPKVFALAPPLRSYRPDFYVIEDRCFYEVCGTRQAYSYAVDKIAAFRREYPQFRLKVVNQGAWKNGPDKPRLPARQQRYRRSATVTLARLAACPPDSLAFKLGAAMRALGVSTVADFARRHPEWSYDTVIALSLNGYRRPSTIRAYAAALDALVVPAEAEAVNA